VWVVIKGTRGNRYSPLPITTDKHGIFKIVFGSNGKGMRKEVLGATIYAKYETQDSENKSRTLRGMEEYRFAEGKAFRDLKVPLTLFIPLVVTFLVSALFPLSLCVNLLPYTRCLG
jgi:hypothetical protein